MFVDRDRLSGDGFTVVESAVDPSHVAALVAALDERFGVRMDEPETWATPLPITLPLWAHQAQWDVRQHPRVHAAFAEVWGRADLFVSQDALGFKAPLSVTPDAEHARALALHWDRDPRLPEHSYQGVLYLSDVGERDGPFCGVPGVFGDLRGWLERHPQDDQSGDEPLNLEGHEIVAVAGKAGDLVIFDSRLPHGNLDHRGSQPRLVQYVAMTPPGFWGEQPGDHAALHASGRANPTYRHKPGFDVIAPGPPAALTLLGRRLAGYDPWPVAGMCDELRR